MSDEIDNSDLVAERDRLLGEVVRLQVSKEMGVPPGLLARGSTADECRALADEALAWRGDGPGSAEPQTAAVSPYNGVGQISRQTLGKLGPADTMSLYRQGRLAAEGAPAPGPRQNGERGSTH